MLAWSPLHRTDRKLSGKQGHLFYRGQKMLLEVVSVVWVGLFCFVS